MAEQTTLKQDQADAWNNFHRNAAKDFIKNIVFIDDRPVTAPLNDSEPPAGAAEKDTTEDEAFGNEPEGDNIQFELTDTRDVIAQNMNDLDIRDVTSRLADENIAASFLFPKMGDTSNDVIEKSQKVGDLADIIVLDWHLKDENSKLTLEILKGLTLNQSTDAGKMQLICIYTGQDLAPVPGIIKDFLSENMGDASGDGHEINVQSDGSIEFKGFRIVSLNKQEVGASDLAGKLISEFSVMAEGLLPSFALSAISVLRCNTHRLLSVFSKDLDPALVGHRLLLPDSDDVETFGLDLLLMQMKSLLSTHTVHRRALSQDRFEQWVDLKCPEKKSQDFGEITLDIAQIKTFMSSGLDKLAEELGKKPRKDLKKVAHNFLFEDKTNQKNQTNRMGRLSKLIREHDAIFPLPDGWRPTLSLGSILKLVATEDEEQVAEYWFCSQPVCDSVRLDDDRFFPLLKLGEKKVDDEDTGKYWIAIGSGDAAKILRLMPSPKNGDFVKFSPDSETKRVMGVKQENSEFYFTDAQDYKRQYQWLADVEPLQAQRAIIEMTSLLSRVGVDEYEALRRGLPI